MSRSHKNIDPRSSSNIRSRRNFKTTLFSTPISKQNPYTSIYSLDRSKSPSLVAGKSRNSPPRRPHISKSSSSAYLKSRSLNKSASSHGSSNLNEAVFSRVKQKIRSSLSEPSKLLPVLVESIQDIADSDKGWAATLVMIKSGISSLIDCYEKQVSIKSLETEKLKKECRDLKKRFNTISKENYDLSKNVEEQEKEYNNLHKQLKELSKAKIEFPMNEDSWKFLVSENQSLSEAYRQLRHDVKAYQYKENKLLKLLHLLKEKGYPVEEMYFKEVESKTQSESNREDSDSEWIVSEQRNSSCKPENVPNLDLSNMSKDSESEQSTPPEKIKIIF